MVAFRDKFNALPRAEQRLIEERAGQLLAEGMSLQALRKAKGRTQVEVAKRLRIKQTAVSRLEGRADLMISTLRKHVRAIGGDLVVIAEFKDSPPVRITGLGEIEPETRQRRRA